MSGVPLPSIAPKIKAFFTLSEEDCNALVRFGISSIRLSKLLDSKKVQNPGRRFLPESNEVFLILSTIIVIPFTLLLNEDTVSKCSAISL